LASRPLPGEAADEAISFRETSDERRPPLDGRAAKGPAYSRPDGEPPGVM